MKDAGGSRTHLNRVAAGRLAVWLQRQASVPSCPRQESNLVLDLRKVVCWSGTPRGRLFPHPPPGNRTRPCGFEDRRAPDTLARIRVPPMPSPGIEPGLQPSESCVLIRHTPRAFKMPHSMRARPKCANHPRSPFPDGLTLHPVFEPARIRRYAKRKCSRESRTLHSAAIMLLPGRFPARMTTRSDLVKPRRVRKMLGNRPPGRLAVPAVTDHAKSRRSK